MVECFETKSDDYYETFLVLERVIIRELGESLGLVWDIRQSKAENEDHNELVGQWRLQWPYHERRACYQEELHNSVEDADSFQSGVLR